MHIHLVGGIYGMSPEFRMEKLQETTETILEEAFRVLGHTVSTDRHHLLGLPPPHTDIAHMHHLATGCVPMLASRKLPMVFTRHATKRLPWRHALVLKATYDRADAVVALSWAEYKSLPERVRRKATVIYNGLDSKIFSPGENQRSGDEFRLLYVGQVIRLKRVHLAIQLLAEARSIGVPAVLTIVSQRTTLLEQVLGLADELGVRRHVTVFPGLPKREVVTQMQSAHLLVQPSETEALSTVVSEACLVGLPVLAFNVGGMLEQLPPGVYAPPPSDTSGWLAQGKAVLADYAGYRARFTEHVNTARRLFSIQAMVESHLALYNDLVGTT